MAIMGVSRLPIPKPIIEAVAPATKEMKTARPTNHRGMSRSIPNVWYSNYAGLWDLLMASFHNHRLRPPKKMKARTLGHNGIK